MYSVKGKKEYRIEKKDGKWSISDNEFHGIIHKEDDDSFVIHHGDKAYQAEIIQSSDDQKSLSIKINHSPYQLVVRDRLDQLIDKMGMSSSNKKDNEDLRAPMPGLILTIVVKEGQQVQKGDSLIILEAMKMENIIKAGQDSTIKEILVEKGQSVEKNQIMIRY